MITPAKIYDFTVPANGTYLLQVTGSYFKLLESFAGVSVRTDKVGSIGVMRAGQGFEQSEFTTLTFEDRSGADNRVSVLLAGDKFVDDRISGSVEVIDGGKNRTKSGAAFSGYSASAAGVGQLSHAQLWNPVGSGKNAIVEQIIASVSGGAGLFIRHYGVALTTLGGAPASKLSGGAATAMQFRNQQNATVLPAASLNLLALTLAGSTPYTYRLSEPIVIQPGAGVVVYANVANIGVDANFEYFEEAV